MAAGRWQECVTILLKVLKSSAWPSSSYQQNEQTCGQGWDERRDWHRWQWCWGRLLCQICAPGCGDNRGTCRFAVLAGRHFQAMWHVDVAHEPIAGPQTELQWCDEPPITRHHSASVYDGEAYNPRVASSDEDTCILHHGVHSIKLLYSENRVLGYHLCGWNWRQTYMGVTSGACAQCIKNSQLDDCILGQWLLCCQRSCKQYH